MLLQSFLQRIVNGGDTAHRGRIEREYGLGRKRTDLLILWPYSEGQQKVVLELKLQHGSQETTLQEGLSQIVEYLDRCGTKEGL